MFRYLSLFLLQSILLLGNVVLAKSAMNPRMKRSLSSYHRHHSSKLSVKDLALELAKKHLLKMILDEQHDLDKAKESIYILERDRCTSIKSVGKPITHSTRRITQGAWMKDPLGIMGTESIFTMEGYSGNVIQAFENMDKFKAGVVHKTYTLPYSFDGTGAVVYGPYLYYSRARTAYIIKYNLHTERLEAQISLGFSARRNHYRWGGYTYMDLAVDEQGLWVLWGSNGNSYRLHASKIDVHSNRVIQTWSLSTERMSYMGNAFVACGVIYCIDEYSSKTTTINFAYDTKTGKQWNPNIKFTNQFGYNSMVDYNPRERVLYGWDNKRLVTYPLIFKKQ